MAVLNRSMRYADVYTLTGEYDAYGTETEYKLTGSCDIFITLYGQTRTDDARYKDVTHVGYTDTPLTDSMQIIQDGRAYKVLLANSNARRCVVFLQEVV